MGDSKSPVILLSRAHAIETVHGREGNKNRRKKTGPRPQLIKRYAKRNKETATGPGSRQLKSAASEVDCSVLCREENSFSRLQTLPGPGPLKRSPRRKKKRKLADGRVRPSTENLTKISDGWPCKYLDCGDFAANTHIQRVYVYTIQPANRRANEGGTAHTSRRKRRR